MSKPGSCLEISSKAFLIYYAICGISKGNKEVIFVIMNLQGWLSILQCPLHRHPNVGFVLVHALYQLKYSSLALIFAFILHNTLEKQFSFVKVRETFAICFSVLCLSLNPPVCDVCYLTESTVLSNLGQPQLSFLLVPVMA